MNQLFKDIEAFQSVVIFRHDKPDLDALGSQVGLYYAIKDNFPEKNVYMVGDDSLKYGFIGKMQTVSDEVIKESLAIILDVSVSYLVSDKRYQTAKKIWVIDHHKNDCDITENWLCDTSRIAAAEYVAYLLIEEGYKISKEAATALYGGIVTDSGRFLYGTRLDNTFDIASKLISFGANQKFIYDNIYIESLKDREMKNYFTSRIQMKDGVAWLENGKEVFDRYPVEFNDISRGMLSLMSGVKEIEIWCNFTFDKDTNMVKCEFRSRRVPIVDIAKELGGGGHELACGCSIKDFSEVPAVIDRFVRLLNN